MFPAAAQVGRVVQNDEARQLDGATVTLGVAAKHQPVECLGGYAGVGDLFEPEKGGGSARSQRLADGEALVLGPDGKGGATLVARIKIEEWPGMRF